MNKGCHSLPKFNKNKVKGKTTKLQYGNCTDRTRILIGITTKLILRREIETGGKCEREIDRDSET